MCDNEGQERDVWSASWTQSWNRYVLDRTLSQLKNTWIAKSSFTVPLVIAELVSVLFCSESTDWSSSPKFGFSLFFITTSWHVHIGPHVYPFSTPFWSYCRWYSTKQYSWWVEGNKNELRKGASNIYLFVSGRRIRGVEGGVWRTPTIRAGNNCQTDSQVWGQGQHRPWDWSTQSLS